MHFCNALHGHEIYDDYLYDEIVNLHLMIVVTVPHFLHRWNHLACQPPVTLQQCTTWS